MASMVRYLFWVYVCTARTCMHGPIESLHVSCDKMMLVRIIICASVLCKINDNILYNIDIDWKILRLNFEHMILSAGDSARRDSLLFMITTRVARHQKKSFVLPRLYVAYRTLPMPYRAPSNRKHRVLFSPNRANTCWFARSLLINFSLLIMKIAKWYKTFLFNLTRSIYSLQLLQHYQIFYR